MSTVMGTRTFFVHTDDERKQEQEPAEDSRLRARPLRREEEQTHIRRSESEAEPATASAGRVLLVDDNTELRRVWTRALRRLGHDITEATSGADALRKLAEHPFDIVLSDIQMPDMSGLELLAKVRAIDPDLAVLVLTGAPEAATVARAQELGAFEYITKPVDLTRLTGSVGRGVAHTRKHRGKSRF